MFLPVVFELHLAELAGVQFFHLITLLNVIAQHFILSTLFLLELTIEFFLFIFKLASQAIDLSIFLTAQGCNTIFRILLALKQFLLRQFDFFFKFAVYLAWYKHLLCVDNVEH